MTERITRACLRTSGVTLSAEAEILRCILDSMAVAIRHAIRDAVRITGREVRTVHVVGGGVANPLFCQLTADACGLPMVAGPTEAASWGNVLVQARALRRDRRIAARAAFARPARHPAGPVSAG